MADDNEEVEMSEGDGISQEEAAPPAPVLSETKLDDAPDAPESEEIIPEVQEPRYIEPLGQATEETLLKNDHNPFILGKMFHEGNMKRLGVMDGIGKPEDGGIAKYENYNWQLEKMFREVPKDMSMGKVRLKPDELMYEEEKWVLGKMFRELREEDGYIPQAEKRESLLDLTEACELSSRLPREPVPCFPPPTTDIDENCPCVKEEEKSCFQTVTSPSGKVYEFAFSGLTAVGVDSELEGEEACGEAEEADAGPSTAKTTIATSMGGQSAGGEQCRINQNCESQIEAVCKAAREAMAIYDTLAGVDNFPCNLGDNDSEIADETVWTWLYQLIYKMVPLERNNNQSALQNSTGRQNTDPSAREVQNAIQTVKSAVDEMGKMIDKRPKDF